MIIINEYSLSPSEERIARLLAEDFLTNKEIAYRLGRTTGGIKQTLCKLCAKLGLSSTVTSHPRFALGRLVRERLRAANSDEGGTVRGSEAA